MNPFKGTTLEALNASPAEIKASTKVTITDNTYTAANLLTILGKTNNHPVVLEKTAAGIPLSAPYADIVTIIEGVNKYTGSLTATGNVPAEQLNIIAKGTTGKVTATLDPATLINAATVTALKDVNSTDNITFVTAATEIVGKSNLEAFVALNKKLSGADWTTIADFKGTASELSAIKSALGIKKTADVEITSGQISAADANALSKAGGALTASLKPGTVKATLSALKDIKATDVLDFTTTETTVNASDLVALEAKFVGGGTQDYTSITTITETAAAVAKDDALTVTTALGYTLATTVDVKISGNISATNAATIAGLTTGTLTATIFPGTAQNLEAALNGVTNGALTLTLTDETVVAGDLDALTAVTTVVINANSVKTITADAANVADVSAVYTAAASKQINGLGNEIISITGVAISAANANILAGLTSGKVVATVTPDAAATLLAALAKADAKDELTLTVTGASDAKDLLALDAKTAIIVDASAVTDITGTAAEIKKVFAAKGIEVGANVIINVTDTAASAADVNAIAGSTNGVVTAKVATGTAAALNKALADAKGTDALTLTISKGTAAAADLIALDGKTLVNVNANAVTTITGSAADVAIVLAATTIDTATDVAVTVSDTTVSVADANTIAAATTGKVTATIAAGTASDLNTALTDTIFPTGGNAYTLTVNGATAAATVLNSLDAKTSVKVKVDAAAVTGDYADLETLYVINKANFANLGDEAVQITGAPTLASQVNTIAKATKGVVTATVADNTADVLVANLKDASATDALTLTVNGASAKAADLNTLDAKTSEDIVVNALNVTGNIADLTKLYITNADNFTASLGDETVEISGTVTAAQADSIADKTTGAVTANIAAGTAAALNTALVDANGGANAYKLTVNGATASAATLELLNAKTSEDIKVDAKEITGSIAEATAVYVTNAADYTNLGNKNVVISPAFAGTATAGVVLGDLDGILDATTGIVTATLTSDTATNLLAKTTKATSKDALTLEVTGGAGTTAAASDLKALDAKTSVTVNAATVETITGSAADIKTVLAAKTITTAAGVDATVDGVISAADANTISKATTGTVTATVAAGTAAALKSALAGVSNDNTDLLTLTVTGTTAAAADLVALDAKTSVSIQLDAASITGNIADVTKVFVTDATHFNGEETKAVTISGEITAAQADAVADRTSGVVTATIAAADANTLNTTLNDFGSQVNAYKLTVNGTTAAASDLNALDGKTNITVNAAAIKNIEGTATAVKAAYEANALKTISGLGNETVDLTAATDANASLVEAINNYTTGVITLDTLNTATAGGNFSLSQLGDLKGIEGLAEINAGNGAVDNITISIKDLLAANDNTNSFTFTITSDDDGSDNVIFTDITTGWTIDDSGFTAGTGGNILFTNNTNSQVITITLDDVVLPA